MNFYRINVKLQQKPHSIQWKQVSFIIFARFAVFIHMIEGDLIEAMSFVYIFMSNILKQKKTSESCFSFCFHRKKNLFRRTSTKREDNIGIINTFVNSINYSYKFRIWSPLSCFLQQINANSTLQWNDVQRSNETKCVHQLFYRFRRCSDDRFSLENRPLVDQLDTSMETSFLLWISHDYRFQILGKCTHGWIRPRSTMQLPVFHHDHRRKPIVEFQIDSADSSGSNASTWDILCTTLYKFSPETLMYRLWSNFVTYISLWND